MSFDVIQRRQSDISRTMVYVKDDQIKPVSGTSRYCWRTALQLPGLWGHGRPLGPLLLRRHVVLPPLHIHEPAWNRALWNVQPTPQLEPCPALVPPGQQPLSTRTSRQLWMIFIFCFVSFRFPSCSVHLTGCCDPWKGCTCLHRIRRWNKKHPTNRFNSSVSLRSQQSSGGSSR